MNTSLQDHTALELAFLPPNPLNHQTSIPTIYLRHSKPHIQHPTAAQFENIGIKQV
jgi:hypothetical protein